MLNSDGADLLLAGAGEIAGIAMTAESDQRLSIGVADNLYGTQAALDSSNARTPTSLTQRHACGNDNGRLLSSIRSGGAGAHLAGYAVGLNAIAHWPTRPR